jgi:hypothetical protein
MASRYTPKAKRIVISSAVTRVRILKRRIAQLQEWTDQVASFDATDEQIDALRDYLVKTVQVVDELE